MTLSYQTNEDLEFQLYEILNKDLYFTFDT